jgi:hypothetical protein
MTFVANPGAGGESFASDVIGGIHYTYSKMTFGPTGTATVVSSSNPFPVRPISPEAWRAGFDKAAASAVDTAYFTLVQTGSGQTVNQTGGSLVVTTGTTTNSETVIRSVQSFVGDLVLRYSALLSQRIANQSFFVELVDVIGDGLALTVNSATSITVVVPGGVFTSANVGQSMYVGVISGVAGIPGRWAIASVSGNNVTFTVAGWPASGSGTVSLFGWNYHRALYSGTTATNVGYDTQRNGYATGDTTATINTTASTHVGVMQTVDGTAAYLDQVGTSATTIELTQRASRVRNIPDPTVTLRVQIRIVNGTSAPASTTTFTVGFVDVSPFDAQSVSLRGVSPMSANFALPVQMLNSPAVTMTSTTLTAVTPGTAAANLGKAEDAVHASGDTGVFALAVRTDTPASTASATGDYDALHTDNLGALQVREIPNPAGLLTRSRVASAASTNATSVKASAGQVYGWYLFNTTATLKFFKLYDLAAAPTVGTSTPVITIPLPPNGGAVVNWHYGIPFPTGIAYAITGAVADADTTAVAANDVHGFLLTR